MKKSAEEKPRRAKSESVLFEGTASLWKNTACSCQRSFTPGWWEHGLGCLSPYICRPGPSEDADVSSPFSLTTIKQLSIIDTGFFIVKSFFWDHIPQEALISCNFLSCLLYVSHSDHLCIPWAHQVHPSLRPLHHSPLYLQWSSLLSLHGSFFIFTLVSAWMSPSQLSLPPCPATLFQGSANDALGVQIWPSTCFSVAWDLRMPFTYLKMVGKNKGIIFCDT